MPGGPQQRPGDPEREHRLERYLSDVLEALQQDLVAVEDRLVLVDARRHVGEEAANLLLEAGWDVLHHAADLEVARVQALPARHFEDVEDLLPVAERVPEQRDRAEVECRGTEPEEVAGDPVELEVDHAQVLGARWDLLVQQPLDRHAIRQRVEVIREVVHPLDERDDLPVRLVLAALLDARVDVADDRRDRPDDLALERQEQPEHPVRRRMVRTHVDREQLGLGLDVGAVDRLAVRRHPLERHRLLALAVGDVDRSPGDPGRGGVAGGRVLTHTSAASPAR